MSKFDKIKNLLNIAVPIAGAVLPEPAGTILSEVTGILNGHPNAPASRASAEALAKLATDNDQQTELIIEMATEIRAMKLEIAELKK